MLFVFLPIAIIIFSIILGIVLYTTYISKHETATFNVSTTNTNGSIRIVQDQGKIEVPSYILLAWPCIFLLGGLFVLCNRLGLVKLENLFFGLIFAGLGGVFTFGFHPEPPFIYISVVFLGIGILISTGWLIRIITGK